MLRRGNAVVLILVILLSIGCQTPSKPNPVSLDEKLKEKVASFYRVSTTDITNLVVLGRASVQDVQMIVYRFSLGNQVILGANQQVAESGAILGGFYHPITNRTGAVSLYGGSSEGEPPFTLFYGHVSDPDIETVVIETSSGEVLHTPVRDEYFYTVLPTVTEWRSVTGLSQQGLEVYHRNRDSD